MNVHPAIQSLMDQPVNERDALGVLFTPREIVSQPRVWHAVARTLQSRIGEISGYLGRQGLCPGGPGRLVLAGAGTSAFVGGCVAGRLERSLGMRTQAIPTTDLVTHADELLASFDGALTLISFARSGNSPESLGAVAAVRRARPHAGHIIVTCNGAGARAQGADPAHDLLLVLPEDTHDNGLAMTASFTGMVVAGLLLGNTHRPTEFGQEVELAATAAEGLLERDAGALAEVAKLPFERAVFLGAGALRSCASECALKLQELTNGRVMTVAETFLGLRHGPQAVVRRDTLVVALLSGDPVVSPYELDMLAELRDKKQGLHVIAVCDAADLPVAGLADTSIRLHAGDGGVPPALRPVTDVIVGQLLGMFKSLRLGLRPDAPSPDGVINRVVEGVRIYDPDALREGRRAVLYE